MSTDVTATAGSVSRLTRKLAVAEARQLVRSATLWGAGALTLLLGTVWAASGDATWDSVLSQAGLASLVLAGALLVLGQLAGSRDHRARATDVAVSLPTPARRRTIALLGLLPVAALAGALVLTLQVAITAVTQPGGSLDPWMLPVPIVLPALGAAIGVAAGSWLPSAATGPLIAFAAAAAIAILPIIGSNPAALAWRLFPVALSSSIGPTVTGGWHLVYLLALLAATISAALLRHRRWGPGAAAVAALLLAVVAVQETGAPAG